MVNKRKVAALGIGFGPKAVAAIGLLPDGGTPPVITGDCGTACCSIITGHFTLGCTPVISKFDLSYGCLPVIPPYVPPTGGGGGPYPVNYHTPQPHRVLPQQRCERTVLITVKFNDDIQWRKLYAVDTCNDVKQANVQLPVMLKDIAITVSNFGHSKYRVAVEFDKTDK